VAEGEKAGAKKTPKGGRKGGALFPKLNLKHAVDYAKKLVAKTHTGAQPEKTILPGVFGSAGPTGKVRASALKQYGLLEGKVDAYKATKLAKDIDAALAEDSPHLLQSAFLRPKLFAELFETFHGDTVSKARIEQRARGLEVHPDSAAECAQLFIESALTAGLGTASGDSISLAKAGSLPPSAGSAASDDVHDEFGEEDAAPGDERAGDKPLAGKNASHGEVVQSTGQGAKPGVAITLTVDSSSDPDKLEKQLKLLRQYGMI
jgi:hypothetical protein